MSLMEKLPVREQYPSKAAQNALTGYFEESTTDADCDAPAVAK
jgi:hypothetical protein